MRAAEWQQEFGCGARASRLISGNLQKLGLLEDKLAGLKGTETALIFGSGFQANSSVLAALTDGRLLPAPRKIRVFSDRLCHASFHFGLATTGARQHRYRHNDLTHLGQLLRSKPASGDACLILTESLFSMEGDQVDVRALREMADRHNAMLYVDEAHATGVCGLSGMGLMAQAEGGRSSEVVLGTFGKALGSYGAYVACSHEVREYLINRCAGLIYSTALPPAVLGAIDAALDLVPGMEGQRQHLQALARQLRERLRVEGFETLHSTSQIVPVVLADDARVLHWSRELWNAGFLVSAIRPPTVPPGTARLRISLSAAHTVDQVASLLQAMRQLKSVEVSG